MRRIYDFNVIEELAKGSEVYAIMFTATKPLVENAATVNGRILARYLQDKSIDWYASEVEDGQL